MSANAVCFTIFFFWLAFVAVSTSVCCVCVGVCVLAFENKNISLYLYITFVRLLCARCAIKTGNVRLTSTATATVAVAAPDPDTCQHLGRAIFGVSQFRFSPSLSPPLPCSVSVCLWGASLVKSSFLLVFSCFYYYCYNFLLFRCVCASVCVCTSVFGTLAVRLSHNFLYFIFFWLTLACFVCAEQTLNKTEQKRTAHANRKILNLIFQMMCEWLRPDIR